ncbi:MarC family protein [Geomonas sp. Red32]|uniref:MarC family protein n=1 Tax=Geomonas sp. Red32 TaxID=2912856 RepID=UPI00202CB6AF|nr:MarC family protein [Geomonas sp. Red32]MCM0083396.1 MarC family protein [Geomonas sp. Red32]
MGGYSELLVVFVVQLFIIVDPLAGIPIFLAITPNKSRAERRTTAWRSCLIAFVVIVFFLVAGPYILSYFGIKTSAVRLCGGILLFLISLELLHGRATGTGTSSREERLAEEKEDVSVTPLAIPLLAGPGAIATTLIFAARAGDPVSILVLTAGAAVVFAITFVFFFWADELARAVGALGMRIVTRIAGLLLAFIAAQYVIDGARAVFTGELPLR